MLQETPVIEGYIRWLQGLTAQNAHRVSQYVAPQATYRTPEAETAGPQGMAQLVAALFDDGCKVLFRVNDVAEGRDGHTLYLRWDRLLTAQDGKKQSLSGISEVMLGTDGKIASVIEYWDSVPEPVAKRGYFARLFNR